MRALGCAVDDPLEGRRPARVHVAGVSQPDLPAGDVSGQFLPGQLNGEGAKKGEGVGTNASNWAAELYVILDI